MCTSTGKDTHLYKWHSACAANGLQLQVLLLFKLLLSAGAHIKDSEVNLHNSAVITHVYEHNNTGKIQSVGILVTPCAVP
jgi:hypothetical protein